MQGAVKVSTVEADIGEACKCWLRSTSSERDNQISADNIDAKAIDAGIAKLEAYANSEASALV